MKRRIHAAAAMLSMLFLAAFWASTVFAEIFFSASAVAHVKQGVDCHRKLTRLTH